MGIGVPKRRAQGTHRLGLARFAHAAGDQRRVEIGQEAASRAGEIALVLENEKPELSLIHI